MTRLIAMCILPVKLTFGIKRYEYKDVAALMSDVNNVVAPQVNQAGKKD